MLVWQCDSAPVMLWSTCEWIQNSHTPPPPFRAWDTQQLMNTHCWILIQKDAAEVEKTCFKAGINVATRMQSCCVLTECLIGPPIVKNRLWTCAIGVYETCAKLKQAPLVPNLFNVWPSSEFMALQWTWALSNSEKEWLYFSDRLFL